jgi:mRNA interferase MazF
MGRRPVVLLSRDQAYAIRELVTIAPATTRVRHIEVEVPLGPEDGLPRPCAVNLDTIQTVRKSRLVQFICMLSREKVEAVDQTLKLALGLSD